MPPIVITEFAASICADYCDKEYSPQFHSELEKGVNSCEITTFTPLWVDNLPGAVSLVFKSAKQYFACKAV